MEEGMRWNSAEQIKEMEGQPSVGSRLYEVNDSIQGPDQIVVTMGNNELQSCSTAQSGVVKTLQDVPSVQYKVKIENFSVLQRSKLEKCICLYLNGAADAFNAGCKFMSVYLHWVGAYPRVPQGGKVYAEYKLRIKHRFGKEDYVKEDRSWFYCQFHCRGRSENFDAFIDYPTLANGFLFNDGLVVEAEIMNIGLVKVLVRKANLKGSICFW
ncbi:hypothetical protein RJ640_000132 [Escallonia rubra]|uniref:MATH domain-containing protein n=1 Tax=Escallonia rubra TaxID=112253 RepID=A0AA88SPG4_9ASTE|nr:hypothetical protein RJ640_000132 [Escallonia rubra]